MSTRTTTMNIQETITKQESIKILRSADEDEWKLFALARPILIENDSIELRITYCSKPGSLIVGSSEQLMLAFIHLGYFYKIVAFCDVIGENHILVDDFGNIGKTRLRKFFRVDTHLEFAVQECNIEGIPIRDMKVGSGGHVDISGGGFRFSSHGPLEPNDIVLIRLNLGNNNFVTTKGKVVRCNPWENQPDWFHIAITFVDISRSGQDKILAFVSEVQRSLIRKGLCVESE